MSRPGRAKNPSAVSPAAAAVEPVASAVPSSVESLTAAEIPAAAVADNGPSSGPVALIAPPAVLPVEATPVMSVAAPRGSVSAVSGDPLAWLGGGRDPLAPIAAPFGWATLAVSRREISRASTAAAPAAAVSVEEPVQSPLSEALSQPGATAALVGAAKQFVLVVAGGGNSVAALQNGIRSLESDPLFRDISLDSLLTDPGLAQAAGSATASVVSALAADPEVRAAVGGALNSYLASALGDLPASIAPSVAGAAVALLADPAAGQALGSVAGTMVSVFLDQPGVVPGLSGIAYQLQGALNGKGFGSALDAAWDSVQTISAVQDGIAAAVAAGGNTALSDVALVGALGTAATTLVNDLAADPSTWTLVGSLLGPTYGDAIVGLLSDPVAAANLADTAGAVLTGFIGQPGVVAALAGTAGDLTAAVLNGTDPAAALAGALDALQADPAVMAAVNSTVSVALRSILGQSAVQDVVSAVAEKVVVNLVTGSPDTSNLSPVVSQLVTTAVDSLLDDTAVQNLISDIAPAIVEGTATSELTTTVIQAVIDQPELQAAVGTAVGTAVGALIGDNPIGNLVGQAVGRAMTALIHAVIRFAPLLSGLGFKLPGAAAAESPAGSGYLFAVTSV